MDLDVTHRKSATNAESCINVAKFLGTRMLHGFLENTNDLIKPETKQQIVETIYDRVSKICKSKLNARNLFHAINEHATFLMNYYIGLVEFEPCELTEIGYQKDLKGESYTL